MECARRVLLWNSFKKSCINELTRAAFGTVFRRCLLFLVVYTQSEFFTALPATEARMLSRVPAADETTGYSSLQPRWRGWSILLELPDDVVTKNFTSYTDSEKVDNSVLSVIALCLHSSAKAYVDHDALKRHPQAQTSDWCVLACLSVCVPMLPIFF